MDGFLEHDYLSHYGILGMKWGIRRYQNKDGSLTAAGKARYDEIYNNQKEASRVDSYNVDIENKKRQKGITSVTPSLDKIKKGTVIKRICDSDEPIDDRVKYVSVLDSDSQNYKDASISGGLGYNQKTVQKEFVLKKDLKVAPAKLVREYVLKNSGDAKLKNYANYLKVNTSEKETKNILKKYGNMRIQDLYDDEQGDTVYNATRWNEYGLKDVGKTKIDKIIKERVTAGQLAGRALFRDKIYKDGNSIYKHFSDLGYDAIVDAEDVNPGLYDYPLIVLEPKKTMSFKKNNTI